MLFRKAELGKADIEARTVPVVLATDYPVTRDGYTEVLDISRADLISTSQIPTNLTVGTSTDCSEIYVGDFSKMIYGMRETLSIQLLDESFALTGEIGFLCHARIDVAVLYPKAFALVTGVR